MASSTTVKTFKYNAAQQPILSVVETPLKYHQIDLSFSSYLKQEKSERDSTHCALDDSEINVFDAQKYFSETNDPKESKDVILSPSNLKQIAEPIDSVSRLSSVSSVDGYNRNFRVRSFHATPTASSEASWNSQTGLLSNPPGSLPVSLRNPSADLDKKRSGSSVSKWFFSRKCPCSGRKSVQVEEAISQVNNTNSQNVNSHQRTNEDQTVENVSNMYLQKIRSNKAVDQLSLTHQKVASNPADAERKKLHPENHNFIMAASAGGFSFPILNITPHHAAASSLETSIIGGGPLQEPPRESLEVFQPPDSSNSNLRKSIEDDAGSDASSDLFEIESFSTSNYPIYGRRDSLEDAPTLNNARRLLTPGNSTALETVYGRRSSLDNEPMTLRTECYAPSEASIDWSVTTAEGFDKASVTNFSITASEIEEFTTFRHRSSSMEKSAEGGAAAWNSNNNNINGKKKIGNGLLSCRHEKAVNVGPRPLKCPQEGPPLQLTSTSGHVSTANRPPKPSVPPASSRSHAARLSLAFAA